MHVRSFDKQNFDELVVVFIGKVSTGKDWRENFDESLAVHQIRRTFPLSKFCAIWYLCDHGTVQKKEVQKKLSKHDGVKQPDDRPQRCTSNTSKHTKLELHVHIPASPNSLQSGKKSTQAKKKPVHTGKKSVQTNSDST